MDPITLNQAKKYSNTRNLVTSTLGPYARHTRWEVWQDFNTLWTPRLPGQVSVDTEHVRYGSQGIRLTSENGVVAWAERSFSATPKNVRNKILWLSVYLDDITKIEMFRVYLRVRNTSWSYAFTHTVTLGGLQSGWNTIGINPLRMTAVGNPDRSELSKVNGIRLHLRAKEGETTYATFDSLMLADNPLPHPMVTLTFDDGTLSDYTEAKPVMSEYNFPGVSYVITDFIGASGKMSLDQCYELQELGWDISSHTATHVGGHNTPLDNYRRELERSYEFLAKHGFAGARHFAYPGGQHNNAIRAEVAKIYDTARLNIGPEAQTIPVPDPYRLTVFPVVTSTTIDSVKNVIDATLEHGQWLIMMFHRIMPDATHPHITPETFRAIVDYLAEKQAHVVTMSEASLYLPRTAMQRTERKQNEVLYDRVTGKAYRLAVENGEIVLETVQ